MLVLHVVLTLGNAGKFFWKLLLCICYKPAFKYQIPLTKMIKKSLFGSFITGCIDHHKRTKLMGPSDSECPLKVKYRWKTILETSLLSFGLCKNTLNKSQ